MDNITQHTRTHWQLLKTKGQPILWKRMVTGIITWSHIPLGHAGRALLRSALPLILSKEPRSKCVEDEHRQHT